MSPTEPSGVRLGGAYSWWFVPPFALLFPLVALLVYLRWEAWMWVLIGPLLLLAPGYGFLLGWLAARADPSQAAARRRAIPRRVLAVSVMFGVTAIGSLFGFVVADRLIWTFDSRSLAGLLLILAIIAGVYFLLGEVSAWIGHFLGGRVRAGSELKADVVQVDDGPGGASGLGTELEAQPGD